jgi:PAS domain S-box-containing protein
VDQPDEPLVHATAAFERITGYSSAEVIGRNCRLLQGPDTAAAELEPLRAGIRDRRRARTIVRNYRKDGTPFWNEVTVFPVTANGERLPWMGGVQHDVTALVDAKAEVRRLNDLLVEQQTFDRAILDGVEVGIVTTDDGGRVTFLNRFARELLREEGDAAGLDVRDLLKLEIGPAALLGAEERKRWAYTIAQDGNGDLDLDLSVSRAEGEHQRVGFFFIFRDLTLEKQQETERRRFEHLAAMGTMVAGFAHEVRNPVASLRALTESLNDELLEANLPLPHIGRMLKVLERVDRLVRTSLQFGRPAAPKRARHRPWTLLSAATTALEPRPNERVSELRVEVEPELPDVFVDDQQIAQVLVILLSNALDATGSARRVLLRAISVRGGDGEARARKSQPPPAPQVRIEVSDDGPGIPAEIIGRIFDPFFTTKPSGTGLGLSIAQQLTSENGGRVEVVSNKGGLTTFSVFLPTHSASLLPPVVLHR